MAVQKRYRDDLSGAIRAGIESALSNQHTTVPGTIVDFDPKTQTASACTFGFQVRSLNLSCFKISKNMLAAVGGTASGPESGHVYSCF